MSFPVIVFGPGPLGLGLVATQAYEAGAPISLIGRSDGRKPFIAEALRKHSRFRSVSIAQREVEVSVERVLFTDHKRDLERLRRLLVTEEDIVVCSAAGAGQSELAGILANEVIPRRIENHVNGTLVLIPCENSVHASLSALRTDSNALRANILYLDAMVDRICKKREVGRRGLVEVLTEPTFEWCIQDPRQEALTTKSDQARRDRAVSFLENMGVVPVPEIESVRRRKRYLMNGVQFCTAIFARVSSMRVEGLTMGDFLDTPEGLLVAENLSYDYAQALATADEAISADQAEQYRAWYLGRILAQKDDDVDRVIGQYSASGLSAFMANRNARILEPFHFIEQRIGTGEAAKTTMGQALAIYLQRGLSMLDG